MADRPTGSAAKRLSFVVLTVLLCIAAAEVFAYVGYQIVRDNVELWPAWRDRVRDRGYQTFLENRYDPLTGWNNPRNEVKKRQNCLNEDWVHIYDGKGARVHSSDEDKPVRVVIVGDSYAAGSEVNGDETFPALLERRLGVRIANHGVGGFGPVQALLNLQKVVGFYDGVEVVVFSVMHENIRRMANSFRPALVRYTGSPFGFKPFIRNGELHGNPNGPVPLSFPELQKRARKAFREDFWSRGEWSFPYVLAWVGFLQTNYVQLKLKSRWARFWGNDSTGYEAYYDSDRLRSEFKSVIEHLHHFAKSKNIRPVVLFIPKNPGDLTSPGRLVADLRARYGKSEVGIIELGRMDIDWNAFNLKPGDCHPSPYGHKMIAETVASHLDF